MRLLGEMCLLTSLVATGYAAFLAVHRGISASGQRLAAFVALIGFLNLTATIGILAWALVSRDFRFEYVSQYASRLLPWKYCLSALWVGQAGSLLLWSWMLAALALVLRFSPAPDKTLRETAFGFAMGNVGFLVAVMVFAADPMAASRIATDEGAGLSPLLQHPSMLIHPPVVFLSYAAWAVPCALAFAALVLGRLDTIWITMARPWALFAWMLLGVGLLLGAHWAYQELGWGGYWGWDPVENGSLLPWLTGTALIHCLMAWRHRGRMKKSAMAMAILTFGLCNFATFLTRSGIFSSVHAFSESPIGWMFLALMALLIVAGTALTLHRRAMLVAERSTNTYFTREALISASVFLLLLLTAVVFVGTLVAPLSKVFAGRIIQVGPEFYNNVLGPIGLALVAMTAVVPLLQWGTGPTEHGRRLLRLCASISLLTAAAGFFVGIRHPLAMAVLGAAALTVSALLTTVIGVVWQGSEQPNWKQTLHRLRGGRRRYAAYCIHLGFVCVAIGVTGSSLGTERQELTLSEGDKFEWAGRQIHYVRLEQRDLPDKLIAEAVLEIEGSTPVELRPARHLHLLQNQWTTEVAIQSSWRGDLYTVLNAGLGDGRIALTLVNNPMMRWIWLGGLVTAASTLIAVWPSRRSGVRACESFLSHEGPLRYDDVQTIRGAA
jgi:cytochrome c-type biogenesis protein CcmF